jgi:hypothetical protein
MTGLALSFLGALALAAPAHAQFGQQQQILGSPVAVPLNQIGQVAAVNAPRQRNINFIALSQIAHGNHNNQVAIIGVTQGNFFNRQPAHTMYMPTYLVPWAKQVNRNRIEVTQVAEGHGNNQVAQVAVAQGNFAGVAEASMKYFFCPSYALPQLFQLNANVVIITQIAIGDGNTQVALVGVAQQNAHEVHVPAQHAGTIDQINANVTVVTQVAVGSGNTQVATLDIGQQNG